MHLISHSGRLMDEKRAVQRGEEVGRVNAGCPHPEALGVFSATCQSLPAAATLDAPWTPGHLHPPARAPPTGTLPYS